MGGVFLELFTPALFCMIITSEQHRNRSGSQLCLFEDDWNNTGSEISGITTGCQNERCPKSK